jgi:hypothetical protein
MGKKSRIFHKLRSVPFAMYDVHMGIHGLLSLASTASIQVEKYYLALSALTPKDVLAQSPVAGPSGLPLGTDTALLAIIGPAIIFFAIFIAVFGVFLLGRIKNWKMGVTALLLAITLGATPFALNMLKQGTDGSVKASPDEIPRNVRIIPLSKTSVQVVWDTDAEKIGAVRISLSPYLISNARIVVGNSEDKTKLHEITIGNLVTGKTYECEILSGSRWYDNEGKRLVFRIGQ